MALRKVLVLLAVAACVALAYPTGHGPAESYASVNLLGSLSHGGYGGDHGGHGGHEEEHYVLAHPKYEYKYGVEDYHTGDYKDAKEERDGDVVKGEYSLLQPDGRKRIVHYTSSKHGGFNAIVSYSGHAIHPEAPKIEHGHY